ncbi:glycosyltransferase family 1 protein [Cellulomonas sp. ICMP 17802]|uniref:rhamnosyltransferase WsaF family glycosyltransferase n=1 Tax=Cellulomonas sp. ICMP 17802 TaxID=3239199 RepID=UPI00351B76E8
MAEELVKAGHRCTIVFYDVFGGTFERHERALRIGWPWLHADAVELGDHLPPADAYVATSWETAHAIASRGDDAGRRLYFVQDFEPYFYGHGSQYVLAEDTYRFGFRTITVGRMLAEMLQKDFGVRAEVAEFGCDTDVYSFRNRGEREGVVFYARPEVARRGYEVGMLALEEFHRRHPEQPIHLFGGSPTGLRVPVVQHGRMTPAQLAALYNQCITGLALSFTNVSLVPIEMIACGAIPVVNDSAAARPGLTSHYARWSQPTPVALAAALSSIVEHADVAGHAAEAAASVAGASWSDAAATVRSVVEQEVYGGS